MQPVAKMANINVNADDIQARGEENGEDEEEVLVFLHIFCTSDSMKAA